jgi:hypothetical protein
VEVSEKEEPVHEGESPSRIDQHADEGIWIKDDHGVYQALMSSLSIIHLHPVSIGQQLRIEVVSDVRVSVFIDLFVFPKSLPVFFPKFGLNQGIVFCEGTHANPSILYLKVEAAYSNEGPSE